MKLVSIKKDPLITIDKKLAPFLDPAYIYVPIEGKLLVSQNETILKNTKLTTNGALSSISGKVIGINNDNYLVIENDYKEKNALNIMTRKNIDIKTILDSTAAESELYNIFKSLKKTDNIVINAINDEPYVINNILYLKENIDDVLEVLETLRILYKAKSLSIIIKNTDTEIIEDCLNKIGSYPSINLRIVADKYLYGKKEIILKELKMDINKSLYMDVEIFIKFIKMVKYNKTSSTKIITISGNAIKKSRVVRTKKYVSLKELIKKYIKFNTKDYVIISGNLLNGKKINEEAVITDNVTSIHFMKKEKLVSDKCIRCGKCFMYCPYGVNPVFVMESGIKSKNCIKCGLCSYICPSHINLNEFLERRK